MRRTPAAVRGASATDEGNALITAGASAESSGAGGAARGGSTSVVPSRISAEAAGATSPGRAHAGAVRSSIMKMISRAAARPITLRNMARQTSAAKPEQRPVQHRAMLGDLGLHCGGPAETHPDRNHRNPGRKPEAARTAEETGRQL